MFFNNSNSFFSKKRTHDIPADCKFIFIADMFAEDYVGGAELTLEAVLKASPANFAKAKAQLIDDMFIDTHKDKFFIFGNFSSMNMNLIPKIMQLCDYAIVECDYKFCKFRSVEKHVITEGKCDCSSTQFGNLIADFYHGAKQIFWMSKQQKFVYEKAFPFLADKKESSVVLSSVFEAETLQKIKSLQGRNKSQNWVMLGSNSWVKGADKAAEWCHQNDIKPEIVWDIPYEQLLEKLSDAKGLVYLPNGADTCPRLTIEARLLGCELILNENVQHIKEHWFSADGVNSRTKTLHFPVSTLDEISRIETYLSTAVSRFWDGINAAMVRQPKISGYVTTYNCVKQSYPFERCIKSLLNFCSEVCVLDGGSKDGTWEALVQLQRNLQEQKSDKVIKLKQIVRDWNSPRFSVFDGLQKAEARKMCSGDYCWQADCDEVFHEDDVKKIYNLCRVTHLDIIALPVIEYWGSTQKVRLDVTPWKWRLTKNKDYITHGIPKELRRFDNEGNLYSAPGSDGCDFVHAQTHERLNFGNFYTQDAENLRQQALMGNQQALAQYEQWMNAIVENLPAAYHYSWCDIERKIKLYRDYWQKHWNNLSNQSVADTAANNMFFELPWSQVTDEMISERAIELATKTGGHVFHTKWRGQSTPFIRCFKNEPK